MQLQLNKMKLTYYLKGTKIIHEETNNIHCTISMEKFNFLFKTIRHICLKVKMVSLWSSTTHLKKYQF